MRMKQPQVGRLLAYEWNNLTVRKTAPHLRSASQSQYN